MKFTSILLAGVLSATSLIGMNTVAYADNTGRVAAAGALGSVVGATVGRQLGGESGAMIGATIGGAGGSAAASDKRSRTESAVGGGLGAVGGYTVGRNTGVRNGDLIGAAVGAAGGAALGNKIAKDKAEEKAEKARRDRIAARNARYNKWNDRNWQRVNYKPKHHHRHYYRD